MRFLALGDSYTIGEGVPAAASWPFAVMRRLRADGIALDPPHVLATTGWTTDELAAGMDAAALNPPYDLVTLQIGVNDQYRGRDLDGYRDRFSALLQRAIALAGDAPGRVLVVSIPDWGVTRFARGQARSGKVIAAKLDAFNAAAREQVATAGAAWVDVTHVSRRCADAPGLLAADGLHPSARQYALWAEAIAPPACRILSDAPMYGCSARP